MPRLPRTGHDAPAIVPAAERDGQIAGSPLQHTPAKDAWSAQLQGSARMREERALHQRLFGAAAEGSVAQRTIHQYKDSEWWIRERGTKGGHPLPVDDSKGAFFNDVTGVNGATFEAVRAGLVDRMMESGGLTELPQEQGELDSSWSQLSAKLAAYAKVNLKAIDENKKSEKDRMLTVGNMYLWYEGDDLMSRSTAHDDIKNEKTLAGETEDFVFDLMAANNQLAFIEQQDWLKNGYHVCIEMNYYYNRPMSDDGALSMHKDTGGDNLFVNLVFDNEEDTPATEWTQDRAPIDGAKREVMTDHYALPDSMLTNIDAAKQKLGEADNRAAGKAKIKGGVMPRHAYVSWVDELVWHSTPTLANRTRFAKGNGNCEYVRRVLNKTGKITAYGIFFDVMIALRETFPTSVLHKINLDAARVEANPEALRKWLDDNITSEDVAKLNLELDALMELGTVKSSGRAGNELDEDGDKQTKKIYKPTGVAGRSRSNSAASKLQAVKEAAARQKFRSFIRTWVRIMKGAKPDGF
ncbi:hypothetical protein ACFJIX_29120 [Roseateles sp. UC29_93]|uniref:hypothetical protein n=1 Tax=Roseateles sp. UC29_93 TaxID=3350177 RepID=UPI00366B78FC